jgi:hypothetical protein
VKSLTHTREERKTDSNSSSFSEWWKTKKKFAIQIIANRLIESWKNITTEKKKRKKDEQIKMKTNLDYQHEAKAEKQTTSFHMLSE